MLLSFSLFNTSKSYFLPPRAPPPELPDSERPEDPPLRELPLSRDPDELGDGVYDGAELRDPEELEPEDCAG